MRNLLKLFLCIGIIFGFQKTEAQENLPELSVLTDLTPPFTFRDEDGTVKGVRVEPVREFLEKTGLRFKINLVPWNRAYNSALTRENILIFDLDRTPARENKFRWIFPLKSNQYQLITRNTPEMKNLTKEDILAGNYKALCEQNTLTCDLFRNYGFPEARIIQFSQLSDLDLLNFIQKERADFIIGSFENIELIRKDSDLKPESFTPILDNFEFKTYLAGSKNMDARVLKKLLETAELPKN